MFLLSNTGRVLRCARDSLVLVEDGMFVVLLCRFAHSDSLVDVRINVRSISVFQRFILVTDCLFQRAFGLLSYPSFLHDLGILPGCKRTGQIFDGLIVFLFQHAYTRSFTQEKDVVSLHVNCVSNVSETRFVPFGDQLSLFRFLNFAVFFFVVF